MIRVFASLSHRNSESECVTGSNLPHTNYMNHWIKALAVSFSLVSSTAVAAEKPNVILIFVDDMGWGDLGVYGNPNNKTPVLDRMASKGAKLNHFYVPAPMCTPSRAGVLTGSYPKRIGMAKGVVRPNSTHGLAKEEFTLADMFKTQGYATACFGKWHIGNQKEFLPLSQGFDEYLGIPYSNDMRPSLLIEGDEKVEDNPDQTKFTEQFTQRTIDFIKKSNSRRKPFFVYLTHPMPHLPLFVSKDGAGKSYGGLYGDVVEEMDRNVGRIIETLEQQGLDENTLVIFTSDNGPWLHYGDQAGVAGPLRGGKNETFEGGTRVPFIAYWPGKIKPSTSTELVTGLDLMPSLAKLAGYKNPFPNKIDGVNMLPVLAGGESSRETFLYFSFGGELEAIRDHQWKYFTKTGELYNLARDIGEKRNVAKDNEDVVTGLKAEAERQLVELEGSSRPVGRVQ